MTIRTIMSNIKNTAYQFVEDLSLGMAMVKLCNDIESKEKEHPELNAGELAEAIYHVEERTLRNWKAKRPSQITLRNMVDAIDGVNTVEELKSFSAVAILQRVKSRSRKDPGFTVCLIICMLVPIVLLMTAIRPNIILYLFSIALMSLSLRAMQNINLFHPNIEVKRDKLDIMLDMIGIASAICLIFIVAV